jgi:Fic family protein
MHVEAPPDFKVLFDEVGTHDVQRVLAVAVEDRRYLHWDELRRRTPPEGLNHREWWFSLKLGRRATARPLPMVTTGGAQLTIALPGRAQRLLHFVDQHCAGEIASDAVVTSDGAARRRYLVNSLMEEAIRSSQLEGATTSRLAAKEMLRTGRAPADRSERMIVNNYHGMEFIREGIGDQLTPDSVLRLHEILTEGTLDEPADAGRLQAPEDERVAVFDRTTDKLLHRPPPATELPGRLQALCDFANSRDDGDDFVHPVVRAIALHFWLGHDHPFADGNGRTARALFYWSMRTQGYWLAEYLAISRILQQAPAQYSRAYVHTETDDGDLTYFLLHQLTVVERAVDELHRYLTGRVEDQQRISAALQADADLNHRQSALLAHAVRNIDATYTFAGHASAHRVTHETARNDLRALEERGLLVREARSRPIRFGAASDLSERIARADRRPSASTCAE